MQALRNNMGYVPKDRDSEAMMINDSIRENFTLPSMGELTGPVGYISPKAMKKLAEEMVEKLSVKCTGIFQSVNALSGGNKQKINLGRWLAKDLKVLVLDCPTRGVDVGVKAYIYALMKEAKKNRIATILISDELTEVIHELHRSGVTIVLISHNMDDVARIATRVAVLDKGKLAMLGTPREVFSRGDELAKMGLDVPQTFQLSRKLREGGLNVPDCLTHEELAQAICAALGKEGAHA